MDCKCEEGKPVGYDAGYCRVTVTVQDLGSESLKSGNLWVMNAGYCRVTGTVQDIWTESLKRGNLWVMMLVIVG